LSEDRHAAQHLARDDLDVLVVDVHALADVHVLHLADDVAQRGVDVRQTQQLVRVHRALRQLLADLDLAPVVDARHQRGAGGHRVFAVIALVVVDGQRLRVLIALDLQRAGDLGEDGQALGLARLEQLGDTGQTVGDVLAGDAAGVERTHGQLRAGLADGLGGDDADGHADVDRAAGGQVPAIAHLADAVVRVARHHGTDGEPSDAGGLEGLQLLLRLQVGAGLGQHLAGLGVHDGVGQATADQALVHFALRIQQRELHALVRAAVVLADDDVLGHVHQAAGQVTGVCGTQGRVGQALAGAVRGDEVLQNAQALAEVALNGTVDDLALRIGHQAAHAGQLADLLDVASSTGVRHHVDGVEPVEVGLHRIADFLVRGIPDVDYLAVALLIGHQAHLVVLVDGGDLLVGLGQDLGLGFSGGTVAS
jgi:hypothetical protein